MSSQSIVSPIVIVYGCSGTGKTRFVLSESALFDRPDVALHGHPQEYAEFRQARRFGYGRGERDLFDAALADPGIRLLVVDESGRASEAFGRDFARRVADADKTGLLLVQTLDEAVELAGGLATRNGKLYWENAGPLQVIADKTLMNIARSARKVEVQHLFHALAEKRQWRGAPHTPRHAPDTGHLPADHALAVLQTLPAEPLMEENLLDYLGLLTDHPQHIVLADYLPHGASHDTGDW